MQSIKTKPNNYLCIKAQTWGKDSHSLYDYESTKIHLDNFCFQATQNKRITLYRKKQSSTVIAYDNPQKIDQEDYQLLTVLQINHFGEGNKIKLEFPNWEDKKTKKLNNNQKLKTQESISSYSPKQQQTYIIVRPNTEPQMEDNKGYVLQAGQSIKLGRVEYYVSETFIDGIKRMANPNPKSNKFFTNNTLKYNKANSKSSEDMSPCKICLDDVGTDSNFLFNPCKCTGSCGTVHLQCLLHWIRIKVKKQVVGGTLHYNFQKFECEICKAELPMIIETERDKFQLLPIIKPNGNYLILEAACEKSKSVMMIQNIPIEGIKLGRGHQCQIRITDISVSRNHALIKFINNSFVIIDNKSKFGTLVRQENMSLDLSKYNKGVQIGRTILSFEIKKEKQLKE